MDLNVKNQIRKLPINTTIILRLDKGGYCKCDCDPHDIQDGYISIFYRSYLGIKCTTCHQLFYIDDIRIDITVILSSIVSFPSIDIK